MRKSRRRIMLYLIAILLGLFWVSVTQNEEVSAKSVMPPAILRIGWPVRPDSLNPLLDTATRDSALYQLVYSTLYKVDAAGAVTPDLVESAEVSSDGLTWKFRLHEFARFHDEKPVTADDVVFSLNLYKHYGAAQSVSGDVRWIGNAWSEDGRTVNLRLSRPTPDVQEKLASLYVLPEHIWKRLNFSTINEFKNSDMIGSGPFRLVNYVPGVSARLAPFNHYYHPRPHLEGIEFQTLNDLATMNAAISTGTVDLLIGFSAQAAKTLENLPNVALEVGAPAQPQVSTVFFNVADPAKCPATGVCTGHPALRNLAVRQALAHATDKQQIINELLGGMGTPGMTLLPAGYGIWYNRQLQDFSYDIAWANQLLDTAGYRDLDGDGVREMPNGQRSLIFRLNWPSDNADDARLAALLSQNWAKIGVRTELAAMSPDALTAISAPAFAYDIIVWGSGVLQDPSAVLDVMTTSQLANGVNETGYSNPEYDNLYRLQATELDTQKRQQMVWKMQELAHTDTPYIIPFYTEAFEAYRTDRFTGWIVNQGRVALEDFSSIMQLRPAEPLVSQ